MNVYVIVFLVLFCVFLGLCVANFVVGKIKKKKNKDLEKK